MPNRAAIVTGASSGIGLAIARMLGEEGHSLTLAARRPEKLTAAAEELRGAGFDVQEVAGNMADEDTIKGVVAAHRERFGRLDVLVNNAGVGIGAAAGEQQTKRVDLQLAVNLRAIVLFYRESVELLRAAAAEHRNALVVNTSAGLRGDADDRVRPGARPGRGHDPGGGRRGSRAVRAQDVAELRDRRDRFPAAR